MEVVKVAPWPLTAWKSFTYVSLLCKHKYKAADNYWSSLKGYAQTLHNGYLVSQPQETLLQQCLDRQARTGLFLHKPADPVTLEMIFKSDVSGDGKHFLTVPAAVAAFTFYFGLRKSERLLIDLSSTKFRPQDADLHVSWWYPPNSNTAVKVKKVVLNLGRHVLKSNHVSRLVVFCQCEALAKIHPQGANICVCKVLVKLKMNPGALATTAWKEVMEHLRCGHQRVHGLRIAAVLHAIEHERNLGYALLCIIFRWTCLSMLIYYARQRGRTTCMFSDICFWQDPSKSPITAMQVVFDKMCAILAKKATFITQDQMNAIQQSDEIQSFDASAAFAEGPHSALENEIGYDISVALFPDRNKDYHDMCEWFKPSGDSSSIPEVPVGGDVLVPMPQDFEDHDFDFDPHLDLAEFQEDLLDLEGPEEGITTPEFWDDDVQVSNKGDVDVREFQGTHGFPFKRPI
jgi:hypothetical protein